MEVSVLDGAVRFDWNDRVGGEARQALFFEQGQPVSADPNLEDLAGLDQAPPLVALQ
jgi:hypothetical protein